PAVGWPDWRLHLRAAAGSAFHLRRQVAPVAGDNHHLAGPVPAGRHDLDAGPHQRSVAREARMSEVLLKTVKLRRTFGGLAANDDISLELCRGQVHALLG